MKSVTEGSTYEGPQALKGFKDGNVTNNDYVYDANGNMVEDKNKDIIIEYNHLNLPTRVTFGNGNRLEWIYDAAGIKLIKKRYEGNSLTLTKDYAGGLEYTNGLLEAIYFDEGRATPNGVSFQYEYSIKDHLGNTRVTFADLNGNGQIVENEILQADHYYPFGMRMEGYGRMVTGTENHYTYNGKELNADFDLDWLDYGARWYDASIARWSAVDPLAEAYAPFSPYAYVLNNPIMLIDPNGRESMSFYDYHGMGSGAVAGKTSADYERWAAQKTAEFFEKNRTVARVQNPNGGVTNIRASDIQSSHQVVGHYGYTVGDTEGNIFKNVVQGFLVSNTPEQGIYPTYKDLEKNFGGPISDIVRLRPCCTTSLHPH